MSSTWRVGEEKEQQQVEAEVKEWFERAKAVGMCEINLYYSPYNKYFFTVSKAVFVHGHKTDMLLYQGGLYQTRSGPGDCELNLWYLGEAEKEK